MKTEAVLLCKGYLDQMIEYRRHLHRHPETSFNEKNTQQFIISVLEKLSIEYKKSKEFYSTVARIKGKTPGPTIAFRADIDALAMQDEKTVEYRSQNDGCAHACGHDGHTAALLGLAHLLAENPDLVKGEVVLVFQHAEELIPGGAKTILEEGLLDGVDAIFGAHLWPSLEVGEVGLVKGAMMASSDKFSITIKGVGGHAAQPSTACDPLLAGAALILQLQSIVSRNVSPLLPAVVGVSQFNAGSSFNVIPETAKLSGTVRCFDEQAREMIERRITEITDGIAKSFGVECEIEYLKGYPSLYNDPKLVELLESAISNDTENTAQYGEASMGGEDFAYYTQAMPGAFFWVGKDNLAKGISSTLHRVDFDMDEGALLVILECFVAVYSRLI